MRENMIRPRSNIQFLDGTANKNLYDTVGHQDI
jgi:hypothetical protein